MPFNKDNLVVSSNVWTRMPVSWFLDMQHNQVTDMWDIQIICLFFFAFLIRKYYIPFYHFNYFNRYLLQVLSGITVPELDVLDAFEDVEYERRTVDVSLMVCPTKIIFIILVQITHVVVLFVSTLEIYIWKNRCFLWKKIIKLMVGVAAAKTISWYWSSSKEWR